MQKILFNKFSDDSGTDLSEAMLESSFKKVSQFKSEYDMRKEEQEEGSALEIH